MNDTNVTNPNIIGAEKSEALLIKLQEKVPSLLLKAEVSLGDAVVHIRRPDISSFFTIMKDDTELRFGMLLSLTAVDWLDQRDERFEVVYHILNVDKALRLRVKVAVPEAGSEVASVSSLWHSALFLEREVWDMYGIRFAGHPDLRRVLMYDEFVGHPLRKDYPLQAKQPRVKLRAPEVQNTARQMNREPLVQIRPRVKNQLASTSI